MRRSRNARFATTSLSLSAGAGLHLGRVVAQPGVLLSLGDLVVVHGTGGVECLAVPATATAYGQAPPPPLERQPCPRTPSSSRQRPRPVEPYLGLQLLAHALDVPTFLAELRRRGGVLVEDRPAAGTSTVTVACKRHGDGERVVLVLDTLTHMHRTALEPFLLREVEHRSRRLHLGAFEGPRRLRTGLGLLRLPNSDLGVGRARSSWKQAIRTVRAPEQDAAEVFYGLDGSTTMLLALPGPSVQPFTDHPGPRQRPLVQGS